MKSSDKEKLPAVPEKSASAQPKSHLWILGLAMLVIIPVIKRVISSYRYNKEIKPIVEGMREQSSRLDEVILGDTGRIFVLSTTDSVKANYRWYNGYASLPNDSLYFKIVVKSELGRFSFSRDTTVGQVVCILKNIKDSSDERERIFGIYFKPESDEPETRKFELARAVIYLVEQNEYKGMFVADTFDKDPESAEGKLALKRLKKIKEELEKKGIGGFAVKVF